MATEEVAVGIEGVESTGFSNRQLTEEVSDVVSELPGDGLLEDMGEAVATSALVSAAFSAGHAIKTGRFSAKELRSALGDATVGTVTAVALDTLLSNLT
jgi:hypothetical protein